VTGTIGADARKLNQALHQSHDDFGRLQGSKHLSEGLAEALRMVEKHSPIRSLIDYGTGKGHLPALLQQQLPSWQIQGYDPAIEAVAAKPDQPAGIVTCLDVLEHVERAELPAVLTEIGSLTKVFAFLIIDLQPAAKTLADGRNAHILLAPPDWWIAQLAQFFSCLCCQPMMHKAGIQQKLYAVVSNQPQAAPIMHEFMRHVFPVKQLAQGGVLESVYNYKKANGMLA